jgi:dTDP-4-amino-4,6-dideoxygalactose transaminase
MRKSFLPLAKPCITKDEIKAATEVLKSGHLTTGPKVYEFENKFSKYIGKGIYAAALNSCTGGLYLGLRACGIGDGDEVIIPTWTFAATAHVVLWTGARPILCDIDDNSLNIDVVKMRKLITAKTKAIIPVHFAGYPCRMDEIIAFAKKHNLIVIEDAAHAVGAEYKGTKVGNLGDITVFSFYATKNLACGEGGMVVSGNKKISEKIRKMSYFGIDKKAFNRYSRLGSWYYEIEELGYKYNMDSIHAAIGLVQLEKLDKMNKRRRRIAELYKKNLDKKMKFTEDKTHNYHTYHLFPIRIRKEIMNRDDFIRKLKERNIGTGVHFIPLHRHPYYRRILPKRDFPVADKVYEEIVSIPMFSGMSDNDVHYVIRNINDILKRR